MKQLKEKYQKPAGLDLSITRNNQNNSNTLSTYMENDVEKAKLD